MSAATTLPEFPATLPATTLPTGANEELAGPPRAANPALGTAPVAQAERISTIDLLRGFSLMGILLMNICDFGLPGWDYTIPLGTVKPVFSGPHATINTVLWFLRWIVAEGKMRALFSMLFGAGILLLTGRAEERGAGVRTADIFTRRNMWLTLFGILHCYLIWNGDILFFYGASALLFMFPFRHCKPKTLFWTAGIVLLLNTALVNVGQTFGNLHAEKAAREANLALAHHQVLTEDQIDSLKSWKKVQNRWRPDDKKLYKNIHGHQGYLAAQGSDASDAFQTETLGQYAGFGDWAGMMLLGMALFRLGFFQLKNSTRTYTLVAVLGLGISWSLTFAGCWISYRAHFPMFPTSFWLSAPYDLTRLTGALGNAAVLLLMVRFGLFKWLLARVANVGQMALSNYILTSLCMKTLYQWSPLHWYGYVEYYKLYYAVAAMWAINLVGSTLWLRRFRFGPLEWCWRSLTYWKRQPMRLSTPVSPTSTPAPPALAATFESA